MVFSFFYICFDLKILLLIFVYIYTFTNYISKYDVTFNKWIEYFYA